MTEPLYKNGGVSIDSDFARFGSKSNALDKINTVDVRVKKANHIGVWVLGLLASLCLLSLVGGGGIGALVLALAFGAGAYFVSRRLKDEYQLFLVTSSSETQAYQSTAGDEVMTLRKAVEDAMVRQRH